MIENEFGQAGLDGDLLRETGTEVRDLVSGCICCTLKGDFAEALRSLVEEYRPDRILIEPSGIFVPTEILSVFQDPEISSRCRLASLTTVVDARHFLKQQKKYEQFFEVQAGYASSLVMSKTDGLEDADLETLEVALRRLNPSASVWSAAWDELDDEAFLQLLDPPEASSAALHGKPPDGPAENGLPYRHAAFSSMTLRPMGPFAHGLLESKLRLLSSGGFGRILRAKGTVPTVAGDTHLRLEYVGGEFEVERVTGRANREPILVVVGTGLDRSKLRVLFA